jgi:hypothetical protein
MTAVLFMASDVKGQQGSDTRGVGQNNGNTTDTVYIYLAIWCWTTFHLNTA